MRLGRNAEVDLPADQLSAQDLANIYANAVEPQVRRKRAQPLRIEPHTQQGAKRHVTGDAAEWIKNGNAHGNALTSGV